MGGKQSTAASAFDVKFKAKEWQWQLKTEIKHVDKEIAKLKAEEVKLQKEIRAQANKGSVETVQMLAKSVVQSRRAAQRLERTKGNMHAVILQLTTSIATMSTSSSMRLSTEIMQKMNAISRIPETSEVMEQMRKEMAKCSDAEDSMEAAFHTEGEDIEAAAEVQKVLEEMALKEMGPLAAVPTPAPLEVPLVPQVQRPAKQLEAVACEAGPAQLAPRPAAQVAPTSSGLPPLPAPAERPPPVVPSGGYVSAPSAIQPHHLGQYQGGSSPPAASDNDELLLRLDMLKAC